MRPIFSPTDFIQIKGRGTRKHKFSEQIIDREIKKDHAEIRKETFKLFDFFANCEYFEEKFNYDELLKLPALSREKQEPGKEKIIYREEFENFDPDSIKSIKEQQIGLQGMKIDRMFFNQFEDKVKADPAIQDGVIDQRWDYVMDYINQQILNKPEEYFTLEKLRKSIQVDRRVSLREMVEKIFGLISRFKGKEELLEEEFDKFVADRKPGDEDNLNALKYFFKAYITDHQIREIIDNKKFAELNINPVFPLTAFKEVPKRWRSEIPEYIKDYVPLNKFLN